MDSKFENIIDKDEKIEKVLKPNKTKMIFSLMFILVFSSLFIVVPMIIGAVVPDENGQVLPKVALWVTVALVTVFYAISIVCICVRHKNTFYAYTNKRIIVRTGVIGIDYKCLDLKSIGAINVNVSWIDKMLRKNTGTITFGSMSSPLTTQSTGYSFSSIEKPYEVYKEIKEKIEENKKEIK